MDRETHPFVGRPLVGIRRPGLTVIQVVVGSLLWLACVGCVAMMLAIFKDGHAQDRAQPAIDIFSKLKLFQSWGQPDLVIVLSGEQHGYIQPCGCTEPQFGGLTRRYNLFQEMWKRGWPTVAFDLGDIPAAEMGPQVLLKYRYSLMALEKMRDGAVSFGILEMQLPLSDAMAETFNHPSPKVICANLIRTPEQGTMYIGTVNDWELVKANPIKQNTPSVGVVGIGGKVLEEGKAKDPNRRTVNDPTVKFSKDTPDILVKGLQDAKTKGADLCVVLYQGTLHDAKKCAEYCQKQRQANGMVPRVDIILCLSDDQLVPSMPTMVGDTQIITVGHKGQYVGAMGVFRSNNPQRPYDLKYQLVHLEPDFKTPDGKEKTNELNQLMEQYAKEVKDDNYLAKYKQTAHEYQVANPKAEYVGSAACMACHPHASNIWKDSKHFKAYTTLVEAKHPSLRQFDGECVKCHTVGFGFKTGFQNENTPLPAIADLKGVGCESCHGPASLHVDKPQNVPLREALNKYKYRGKGPEGEAAKTQRMNHMGDMCQKCHDMENDPKFNIVTYWPKVEHMTPPPGIANGGPKKK